MVIHKQKEGKVILSADIILFEISRDATTQIKNNINYPQAKAPFTNGKQFKKWNLRDPLYLLIIRINLKRSDMDKNINGKTQWKLEVLTLVGIYVKTLTLDIPPSTKSSCIKNRNPWRAANHEIRLIWNQIEIIRTLFNYLSEFDFFLHTPPSSKISCINNSNQRILDV